MPEPNSEPNAETKSEEKENFIKDMGFVIMDKLAITAVTTLKNLDLSRFTKLSWVEFKSRFTEIKESEIAPMTLDKYNDSKNAKLSYRKSELDQKLKAFGELINGKLSKKKLEEWLNSLDVYLREDTEFPLVVVNELRGEDKSAFIIAPLVED